MKMLYSGTTLGLLLALLLLCSQAEGLLTSSPTNLDNMTNNILGLIIIGTFFFYFATGIVALVMTVSFSTKEAKQAEVDALQRLRRSVPAEPGFLLDMALLVDRNYCLSRLVCEVETDPQAERNREEELLISLFGPYGEHLQGSSTKNRKNLEEAKQIGKTKDLKACRSKYNQCPLSAEHIFDLWKIVLSLHSSTSSSLMKFL